MKNVALYSKVRSGKTTYEIATVDYTLDEFFSGWAKDLKGSFNTRKNYCGFVANFLDYILEVGQIYNELTPVLMLKAIDAYESFLVFGADSDSDIAKKAATNLSPTPKKGSSLQPIFAAVNNFIEASENYRVGFKMLKDDGLIGTKSASTTSLFDSGTMPINQAVAAKIKQNSWLAGCISGGAKKLKKKALTASSEPSTVIFSDEFGGDNKTFPFDKAMALINAAPCYRDKALWALIAATGCRISEALTVLFDDIDGVNKRIFIVTPSSRKHELRKYLSETEIEKISHKGRDKPDTFPIRPFDVMFWKYLDKYMNTEFQKGASHRFIFQKKDGTPFVKSYRAALQVFHKTSLQVTGGKYGFHSLRHMYGYYLKNWCPNGKGWGLSIGEVKAYMGHSSVKSTERYAREDAMKLRATIDYANLLNDQRMLTSIADSKIQYLEQQISRLKELTQSESVNKLEVMEND